MKRIRSGSRYLSYEDLCPSCQTRAREDGEVILGHVCKECMRIYYNRAAKVKYRKIRARERARQHDTAALNPHVVATYRKLREEFRAKLYAAKQDVKVYQREVDHLNKVLKGRRLPKTSRAVYRYPGNRTLVAV